MSSGSKHEAMAGEALSALVDGEADAAMTQRLCAAWRDDAASRATWHAYQLIGDVLRSEDLAAPPARDAAFLARLRGRLADEPVVLAPQPLAATADGPPRGFDQARRRRTWIASSAVAAGFVAVAGVVVVLRGPEVAPPPEQRIAAASAPAATPVQPMALARVSTEPAQVDPEVLVVNGKMIRDARLDRYLAAHKQFAGSSALGVPSSFLRSATVDAANR